MENVGLIFFMIICEIFEENNTRSFLWNFQVKNFFF